MRKIVSFIFINFREEPDREPFPSGFCAKVDIFYRIPNIFLEKSLTLRHKGKFGIKIMIFESKKQGVSVLFCAVAPLCGSDTAESAILK